MDLPEVGGPKQRHACAAAQHAACMSVRAASRGGLSRVGEAQGGSAQVPLLWQPAGQDGERKGEGPCHTVQVEGSSRRIAPVRK